MLILEESFSSRLRILLELHGESLKDAALKLGLNYDTLKSYASGTNPPLKFLDKLVKIYDAKLDWLVSGKLSDGVSSIDEFFIQHNFFIQAYQKKIIELENTIKELSK